RPLAAVRAAEVGRLARFVAARIADVGRSEGARVVALARPLDLDHLGAEVAQVLTGPRSGQHARHVEHADVRKGSCHGATFTLLFDGRGAPPPARIDRVGSGMSCGRSTGPAQSYRNSHAPAVRASPV